ncbi:putative phenylalanine ammonia-lyase [Colletotrichum godetiae]|uniref:Phenylalanine ammonia-lyase n=1 Tax=Colletotrichum godetiae TaxID=1209918 RepID=A0AAJ0AAS0_9PEZI|nr:putative phenylalanine ammonia-lyase [Colletotrichum godetiae]KAK1659694.1 putative phenylalanine ammonia-lyase [Colletotrichum godetiae]
METSPAVAGLTFSCVVDGQTLLLSDVVAVSHYHAPVSLTSDANILNKVHQSTVLLRLKLRQGATIYGITTGFGGSADVRTSDHEELQRGLLQLPQRGHALPTSIVRGMFLIRVNSLLRGHSGVRLEVLKAMLTLLDNHVIPIVPLRASISASGDLIPLSYIAGVLEGNSDVYVVVGTQNQKFMTEKEASKFIGMEPVRFEAKEALGITNGTATSAAAACIVMHQAHQLATMSQFLTAMATEALRGRQSNYHPFISQCRPHLGQMEAAATILRLLSGSKLTRNRDDHAEGLVKGRYPLRTAPQWIGYLLEVLMLAQQQVQVEINNTTDNPLFDVETETVHQGGNFQALAITSAMEKVSSSMQLLGKLMFAQCTELLNAKLNDCLPPNLAVDKPSKSFTTKGLDITMAAYMSELAHLSHPVSAHIQSAEMNNQSINSLALIAARNALEMTEILFLKLATYVYAFCQALDLECLNLDFCNVARPAMLEVAQNCICLLQKWNNLVNLDVEDRGRTAAREATGGQLEIWRPFLEGMHPEELIIALKAMDDHTKQSAERISHEYCKTRLRFLENPSTGAYLGVASKAIYKYVRKTLGVPIHRGLQDYPPTLGTGESPEEAGKKTIGTLTSEIYVALRNGSMHDMVMSRMFSGPKPLMRCRDTQG